MKSLDKDPRRQGYAGKPLSSREIGEIVTAMVSPIGYKKGHEDASIVRIKPFKPAVVDCG